jgi:hypothetical protein
LIDPNGIENPITWIWRFAFGLTQEPAARLPYLALARDLAGLLYTIGLCTPRPIFIQQGGASPRFRLESFHADLRIRAVRGRLQSLRRALSIEPPH